MLALNKYIYTPEDYFTLEEKDVHKHEDYQGEIRAMAGTSLKHNRLVLNIGTEENYLVKKST